MTGQAREEEEEEVVTKICQYVTIKNITLPDCLT